MRPTVHVRAARATDLPAVVAIAGQSGRRRGRDGHDDAGAANLTALLTASDRIVLCAVDEHDSVVGFLVAGAGETDMVAAVPAMVISVLRVTSSFRRRGAGRALLADLVREAERRGLGQVVAAADIDDREANRYLARLGFAPQVVRRVSTTAALRRTLGLNELEDRALMRHRLVNRPARGTRVLRRGA